MASHFLNVHTTEMPSPTYKGVWSVNLVMGTPFPEILYHLYHMNVSVQVVTRTAHVLFHIDISP